jgi:hypothetical protein
MWRALRVGWRWWKDMRDNLKRGEAAEGKSRGREAAGSGSRKN